MSGGGAAEALGAAACFGAGDFLGGMATRRLPTVAVVAASHLLSLAALAPVAVVVGATDVRSTDLALGVLAGVVGGAGVALLYAALARGAMSVTAPVTAVVGAALPVLVGIGLGDRPGAAGLAGVILALVAVVLLSRHPAGADRPAGANRALLEALGAGLAFGGVYVLLSRPGAGSGLWALVAQRSASAALFTVIALAAGAATARTRANLTARLVVAVAACGLLDTTANVLYLTATRHGLLSLVAVLASLYPAGTVVLARVVLGERLHAVQAAGIVVAFGAVVLIAL